MRKLIKKPIFIFWIILLLIAIIFLATKGLSFGVDFSGGTAFQIVLEHPVSSDQLNQVKQIIEKRIDKFGSKDAKVTPSGSQYILAQFAESDSEEVTKIKDTILRQGNFEAVLNSEVLFSGNDIKTIFKDPSKGYGSRLIDRTNNVYQWTLPFLLSPEASQRFAEMIFHKCVPTGYGDGQQEYDCEKTYFFIDRPKDQIILIDSTLYFEEKKVPTTPELASDFIPIEELFDQLTVPHYVIDQNLDSEQLVNITSDFNTYKKAIVSPGISESVKEQLEEIGYVVTVKEKEGDTFWMWSSLGLESVISITPGVANMDVPTIDSPRFETFTQLTISGQATGSEEAKKRLDDIDIILVSGSLPVPIESISTESISPYLGRDFLKTSLWIGIFALLTVAVVLFIRYKYLKLSLPILLTGASEILLLLGVLSVISFRLDLAAVAGILATIGVGMDDNIIIIDELLRGRKKGVKEHNDSLMKKTKNAFFIMFAAAATLAATMIPIFGLGLGKLTGFAVTILIGAAIGILITRPVYALIARKIVSSDSSD